MAKQNTVELVGRWSFIVGIVFALVIGIFAVWGGQQADPPTWAVVLVAVLGLIVGLVNVTGKEVRGFLISSIAFLVSFQGLGAAASVLGGSLAAGVSTFFWFMVYFIAPAAAIVAFRELFKLTKD